MATNNELFCVNCRHQHISVKELSRQCTHPEVISFNTTTSPVTGKAKTNFYDISCYSQRNSFGDCGRVGKLWEPRTDWWFRLKQYINSWRERRVRA